MTRNRPDETGSREGLSTVSVHDAVLAAIPVSLGVAALVGFVLPLSAGTALAAGSVPATGTIGYALFYNPPGRSGGQP